MWRIYRLPEDLLASHEQLCFMELVGMPIPLLHFISYFYLCDSRVSVLTRDLYIIFRVRRYITVVDLKEFTFFPCFSDSKFQEIYNSRLCNGCILNYQYKISRTPQY